MQGREVKIDNCIKLKQGTRTEIETSSKVSIRLFLRRLKDRQNKMSKYIEDDFW